MRPTGPQILVSTDWVAEHLLDPTLRVFDCTGRLGPGYVNSGCDLHYRKHHIPRASYLDVANPQGEMSDPDAGIPFTWPTATQFAATMAKIGVDNQCRVILYAAPDVNMPGSDIFWATRAWWLMHHFGVDCAVLNGGWTKWLAEKRPVSAELHTYPSTEFTVAPGWRRGLATKDTLLEALNNHSACIVDALSPESYRGEIDKFYGTFGSRKGHISGAVNIPFQELPDPDTRCFPDSMVLRDLLKAKTSSDRIITYCGSGVGATLTGFVFKLAGWNDVSVYDASLMEWANDPLLPMTDRSDQTF